MQIYIASSWKNQHAVEMLTDILRAQGHEVKSFVENSFGESYKPDACVNFEEWIKSEHAQHSFKFDTKGATESDAVIYIGPSGCDAWAEVGAAWSRGIPIYGLISKDEQIGLMRFIVDLWSDDFREIAKALGAYNALRELA